MKDPQNEPTGDSERFAARVWDQAPGKSGKLRQQKLSVENAFVAGIFEAAWNWWKHVAAWVGKPRSAVGRQLKCCFLGFALRNLARKKNKKNNCRRSTNVSEVCWSQFPRTSHVATRKPRRHDWPTVFFVATGQAPCCHHWIAGAKVPLQTWSFYIVGIWLYGVNCL